MPAGEGGGEGVGAEGGGGVRMGSRCVLHFVTPSSLALGSLGG